MFHTMILGGRPEKLSRVIPFRAGNIYVGIWELQAGAHYEIEWYMSSI